MKFCRLKIKPKVLGKFAIERYPGRTLFVRLKKYL